MVHRWVRDLLCEPNIYVSWFTSELRVGLVPLSMLKPSSNVFTDRSKAVHLLWILFVIYVSCLSLLCYLVCFLQHFGHLLGKGWPLISLVCDVFIVLSHSHMVSRYKGGTWLYRFLIFALCIKYIQKVDVTLNTDKVLSTYFITLGPGLCDRTCIIAIKCIYITKPLLCCI